MISDCGSIMQRKGFVHSFGRQCGIRSNGNRIGTYLSALNFPEWQPRSYAS